MKCYRKRKQMIEIGKLYVEKKGWIVKVWTRCIEIKSKVANQYHPHIAAWVKRKQEIILKIFQQRTQSEHTNTNISKNVCIIHNYFFCLFVLCDGKSNFLVAFQSK